MKKKYIIMKVYVLIQPYGSYEDSGTKIIGVYENENLAKEDAKIIDNASIINPCELYSIVPEDIYYNWPFDEEANEWPKEYEGYTIDEYRKQEERLDLFYYNFSRCYIEEHDFITEN